MDRLRRIFVGGICLSILAYNIARPFPIMHSENRKLNRSGVFRNCMGFFLLFRFMPVHAQTKSLRYKTSTDNELLLMKIATVGQPQAVKPLEDWQG